MAEKRRRRTAQELIEDIEKQIEAARGEIEAQQTKLEEIKKGTAAKIKDLKAKIKKLESRKENLLNPKPRTARVGMNKVMAKAKAMGMSPKEIAEKLGIDL